MTAEKTGRVRGMVRGGRGPAEEEIRAGRGGEASAEVPQAAVAVHPTTAVGVHPSYSFNQFFILLSESSLAAIGNCT